MTEVYEWTGGHWMQQTLPDDMGDKTEVYAQLLSIATEMINGFEIVSKFRGPDDPQFDKKDTVHDWRNYVPKAMQRLWPELSQETRLAMYILAEILAEREEWD